MVSKKWQKRQAAIEHLVLFGVRFGALFWFELPLPNELKLVLVAGSTSACSGLLYASGTCLLNTIHLSIPLLRPGFSAQPFQRINSPHFPITLYLK